jgi:hypothetical protein
MPPTAPRIVTCNPLAAWLGLWLVIVLPALAAASPPGETPQDPAGSLETRDSEAGRPGAATVESKKHALTLGFVMLASIIIGGTILLALVVVWGNRARRLARSPLPEVAVRDELWFLKPKKGGGLSEAGDDSVHNGPDPK